MCGFMGCYVKQIKSKSLIEESLILMNHRGPDHSDYNCYSIENSYLYLAHKRLSIIDLSDLANQPFESICGNYTIVYNGEIYNYKELLLDLKKLGYEFKTQSDTEVLLYAFVEWGEECLRKLIGMFSFVFYDKQQNTITLVRDAFGIKPFYYSYIDGELYFSSEIRVLTNIKNDKIKPNLQRAYDYLVHGDYDSTNDTFVDGVKHLPPAHLMKFDLKSGNLSSPVTWWQPNISVNLNLSYDDAKLQLKELFLESVKLHLRSDVPLGIAVSGGVDSSSVAATVRFLNPDIDINTFSYIAGGEKFSEEKWVDLINEKINAIPHKVFPNEHDLLADLDHMILMQGEPFGGTSIYAQYKVFKLIKHHNIKVTLDGQGADELLAGYDGYPGHRLLSLIESEGIGSAFKYIRKWKKLPGRSYKLAIMWFGRVMFNDFIYSNLRKIMGRDFKPKWLNVKYLKDNKVNFRENRFKLSANNKGKRVKEVMKNSLSNRGLQSLLRHCDRNSMAFSIESRVPFLTIPLTEFLFSLPENYLISEEGITKRIFRDAMRGIVPDSILDRMDKIGYETPERDWLLKLSDVFVRWIVEAPELPYVNKKLILDEINDIIKGDKSFDYRIWNWANYLRWCTLMGVK
jgi:asparagine synthase (glutamine-hydrolysing)